MELVNTGRSDIVINGGESREPWAVAIRNQYGPLSQFVRKFNTTQQKYCLDNVRKAVFGHLPTFGRVAAAYGEKAFACYINTHLTAVVMKMGEEQPMDAVDIQSLAESIIESRKGRVLCFTTVLGFFHALKTGEYDIYGRLTPFKVMEAFRKYCDKMATEEDKYLREREEVEAKIAFEKSRTRSVSWKEYAALRRINDRDCMSYAARTAQEYRDTKSGVVAFLECVKRLTDILSFVSDLMQIKKIS